MGSMGQLSGAVGSFRKKFLASFLSVVLVFSTFELSAFASGDDLDVTEEVSTKAEPSSVDSGIVRAQANDSAADVTASENSAAQEQDSTVIFDFRNTYVLVDEQPLVGTKLKVSIGNALVFTPCADEGFSLGEVKASNATTPFVPLEKKGNTYTIEKEYVDNSLVVTVSAIEDIESLEELGKTGSSGETNPDAGLVSAEDELGVTADSGEKITEDNSDEVGALDDENDVLKLIIEPDDSAFTSGIHKMFSGGDDTFEVIYNTNSYGYDGAIVAIPLTNPRSIISVPSNYNGIKGAIVDSSVLSGVTGLDTSIYNKYFVAVIDTRGSVGSSFRTFSINFSFEDGLTVQGATQDIMGYIIGGAEAETAGEGLLGTDITLTSHAKAERDTLTDSYKVEAEVEDISFFKSIVGVNDGGISSTDESATLIDRAYADASNSGNYTITYRLTVSSNRSGLETGRLHIDGPITITDTLSGFLAAGKPQSIRVSGNGVTTRTISATEIESGATDGGKTYTFNFEATPQGDKNTITTQNYEVVVSYKKDSYTNRYEQIPVLVERQKIDNKATAVYTPKATNTPVTLASATISNRLGYNQLAPGNIGLSIQKKISVKGAVSNYTEANQIKYPAESGAKVVFELKGTGGNASGETKEASPNAQGLVSLSGLKPSSEYDLIEKIGIKDFNGMVAKRVKTGALQEDGTFAIHVKDLAASEYDTSVDYATGESLGVVNVAKYDGTVAATVTQQYHSNYASTNTGKYLPYANCKVTLWAKDGDLYTEIASQTADVNGKVLFENIPIDVVGRTYELRVADATSYTVTKVTSVVFNSQNDASHEIKYTSTFGGFKVGAKITSSNGMVCNSTSHYALYSLINTDTNQTVYNNVVLYSNTKDASAQVRLNSLKPGNYRLETTYVYTNAGTETPRFETVKKEFTVTAGVFDTDLGVLDLTSTWGQAMIMNFNYGSTPLEYGNFNYFLTNVDSSKTTTYSVSLSSRNAATQTWASSYSYRQVYLPAGQYTIRVAYSTYAVLFDQVTNSLGDEQIFEVKAASTPNLPTSDSATSSGVYITGNTGTNFKFVKTNNAVNTVGFLYGVKPVVRGTKVSSQDKDTPLAGASFTAYAVTNGEEGDLIYTSGLTSLSTNTALASYNLTFPSNTSNNSYGGLAAGKYVLEENSAPADYAKNPNYVRTSTKAPTFTITYNDYAAWNYQLASSRNNVEPASIQGLTNPPTQPLQIKMTGTGGGSGVAGATYALYDSSDKLVAKVTTNTADASGYTTFKTVNALGNSTTTDYKPAPGEYTIKQTGFSAGSVAAKEYMDFRSETDPINSDNAVKIIINDDGYISTVTQMGSEKYAGTGAEKIDGEENLYKHQISFTNLKKPSLSVSKTGDTNVFVENSAGKQERTVASLVGAEFKFYRTDDGEKGLIADAKGNATEGSVAQASSRITQAGGGASIHALDPSGTYKISEISVPRIEGTYLGRQTHGDITNITFASGKNAKGEITGYTVKTASGLDSAAKLENSVFHIYNPVEQTYQLEIAAYTLPVKPSNAYTWYGVFDDAAGAVFYLQLYLDGQWVTVDILQTGSAEDTDSSDGNDYTGDAASGNEKVNLAVSSKLPAGEYRVVQTKGSSHSNFIKFYDINNTGDKGTTYPGGDPGAPKTWEEWTEVTGSMSTVVVDEEEGVSGFVWPNTYLLGSAGLNNSEEPNRINLANDDVRSTGDPYNPGYHFNVHLDKWAVERVTSGGNTDDGKGDHYADISGVKFRVEFGYLDSEGKFNFLQASEKVKSGTVTGEEGGFITGYIKYPTAGQLLTALNGGTPCFRLIELGPVPADLVQPGPDGKEFLVPVEMPAAHTGNVQGYFTLYSDQSLGYADTPQGSKVIPIKNYKPEAQLTINKYSLSDLEKNDQDKTPLAPATFDIYESSKGTRGEKIKTIVLTEDMEEGSNTFDLLAGDYIVVETNVPTGYNVAGKYKFNGGEAKNFSRNISTLTVEREKDNVLDVYDSPLAKFSLDNFWSASTTDSTRTATYSLSYQSGSFESVYLKNHTQNESITVSTGATLVQNLPDGVYLLREMSINDEERKHYKNQFASKESAMLISISNGKVQNVRIKRSDDAAYTDVDNLITAYTNTPIRDQIRWTSNTDMIAVNHYPKSNLRIVMSYIDELGLAKSSDNRGKISAATFKVEKEGNSSFNETITFDSSTKKTYGNYWYVDYPLEIGAYKITQLTVADEDSEGLYAIDGVSCYVRIDYSGKITYLQNNGHPAKTESGEPDEASGVAGQSAAAPLQPAPSTIASTTYFKYFYNKMNAAKLVITKVDSTNTSKKLTDAEFTITDKTNSSITQNATAGDDDLYTFANVVAAQDGNTTYKINETSTPDGYYVDASTVEKKIAPNTINTLTVYNVPLASIKINKKAQMPQWLDENGDPAPGTIHDVLGLDVKLYREGDAADKAISLTTDESGNVTFANLLPGKYRIEEQKNLGYLNVDANALYNSVNTDYHFEVIYTSSPTNSAKKVEIKILDSSDSKLKVDYDKTSNTIKIMNDYVNDSILLSAKKISASSQEALEGAQFELCDNLGNALVRKDGTKLTATSNDKGIAYFQFIKAEVFQVVEGTMETQFYNADYYIKEVDASPGYVVGPYIEDCFKKVMLSEEEKSASTIIFENRDKAEKPLLGISKNTTTQPQYRLTQSGLTASYTISMPAVNNALPIKDYTIIDRGYEFKDDSNLAITDARLTYTLTEVSVAKTTSDEVLDGKAKTIYAKVNESEWKALDGDDPQVFTFNAAGNASLAKPLFTIVYGEKNSAGTIEPIVGKNLQPGDITVNIAFDRFALDASTAINDVKTAKNTVAVMGKWPTQIEGSFESIAEKTDDATITFPGLPTMKISTSVLTATENIKRGSDVQYSVTLDNPANSGAPIVNPTIIVQAAPYTNNGLVEVPMYVVLNADGTPKVDSLTSTLLVYRSYSFNGGAAAAWVFKGELNPGESITIAYSSTINGVVLVDDVTSNAYGTALPDLSTPGVAPNFYAADNKPGATFKAGSTVATQATVVTATENQINGGLTVIDKVTSSLGVEASVKPSKAISTDKNNWFNKVDVRLSEQTTTPYYYRLQALNDNEHGKPNRSGIKLLDVLPYSAYLGTGWNDNLNNRIKISEITVKGIKSGTFTTLTESVDYDIVYSTSKNYADLKKLTTSDASSSDFNSFMVVMKPSFELKPKEYVEVTYKAEAPVISEGGYTYAMLAESALKDAVSDYLLIFKAGSEDVEMKPNNVAATLRAPKVKLEGIAWTDTDRDGIKNNDETIRDDVWVTLYKSTNGVSIWERETEAVQVGVEGSYCFAELESSYGGGPVYKIEAVNPDKDVYAYSTRPTGSQSSDTITSINSVNADNTIGTSSNLILNVSGKANIGLNTIPYKVEYRAGITATEVSNLPAVDTNLIAKTTYTVKGSGSGADATPSAPGYTFVGWKVTADASESLATASNYAGGSTFVMPANDVVLTAQWQELPDIEIQYRSVTQSSGETQPSLSERGGTVSRASEEVKPATGNTLGSTGNNKPGYQFDGWYVDALCTTPVDTSWAVSGTTLKPGKSFSHIYVAATYYAKFVESTNVTLKYEVVTFDITGSKAAAGVYGGTLSSVLQSLPPSTGVAAGSKATAKTFYRFDGWYADVNCETSVSSTWVSDADGSTVVPTKASTAVWVDGTTYYAKFVEETSNQSNMVPLNYEVRTFDAEGNVLAVEGGSASPASEKVSILTGEAAGSVATARIGYSFEGWFTDESCSSSVANTWLSEDNGSRITPEKAAAEWPSTSTYYAKMVVDITKLKVDGYVGIYDGQPHGVTLTGYEANDDIKYFSDNQEVDNAYVDVTAGVTVSVEVRRDGALIWSVATRASRAQADVVITPRPLKVITGSASRAYNGQPLISEVISVTGFEENFVEDEKEGISSRNISSDSGLVIGEILNAFTTGTITNVGTADNTYDPGWVAAGTTAKKSNYRIVQEDLGELKVFEADYDISSESYLGVYDAENHGIIVNAPSDAQVTYSTDNSYVNVTNGAIRVDYTVERANYKTITGYETVTITPLTITVTANNASKIAGQLDPILTCTNTRGIKSEMPGFTGHITRAPGEAAGNYPIAKGSLTLADNGAFKVNNYRLIFNPAVFTIEPRKTIPLDTTDPTDPIDPIDPIITPIVDTTGASGNAMVDTITAIIKALEELAGMITPTTEFDEEGVPLTSAGVWCWVHWYILLGIIVTAAYSAAVITRRRRFTRKLKGFENEILKIDDETADRKKQDFSESATQGMGA